MLLITEANRLRSIIGIDPGSRLCGWGVVTQSRNEVRHLDNGVIVLDPNMPLHRNAQSALVLGHARGTALTCLALHDLSVQTYAPTEIKKLVAGHGRASKEQMQIMVARHLNLGEAPQSDAADAAAVALCHALHLRLGIMKTAHGPTQKKYSKKQSDALLMKLARTRG